MARRRRSTFKIPGVSFSWKRALGITRAKQQFARKTGIPTTRAGRQRKIGRMVTGGGCLFYILYVIILLLIVLFIIH